MNHKFFNPKSQIKARFYSINILKFIVKMWTFYTKINLNENYKNDPLIQAFDKFLETVLLDINEIIDIIEQKGVYRIIIDTEGENDKINPGSQYVFYKSVFMKNNKKFRQKLLDYYVPLGIFVKGPIEIISRTSTNTTNKWYIELSKFKNK